MFVNMMPSFRSSERHVALMSYATRRMATISRPHSVSDASSKPS